MKRRAQFLTAVEGWLLRGWDREEQVRCAGDGPPVSHYNQSPWNKILQASCLTEPTATEQRWRQSTALFVSFLKSDTGIVKC